MDYIFRMFHYFSINLWLNIALVSILPIVSALLYFDMYRSYIRIRKTSGEATEKWLSPILFGLIILIAEIILLIINYLTEENLLFSLFFDDYIYCRLISLAALLIIPIIAALIYRREYMRLFEGKSVSNGIIKPRTFGIIVLIIEAALGFTHIFLNMLMYF